MVKEGSWKTEVGSWKTEVRSWKTEEGSWKTEVELHNVQEARIVKDKI